jgi:putative transposase
MSTRWRTRDDHLTGRAAARRACSPSVPKAEREMVAALIRTIFAQPNANAVREQLDVIAVMLGRQFPKVQAMLERAQGRARASAAISVR